MGIISIENTDRLYWLGRYTERVYTTIRLFTESYDTLIDGPEGGVGKFCDSLEIPNIYRGSGDFAKRYCFDKDNPDSIISNLTRAYDNAIVLREEISSEVVSFVQLTMYGIEKAQTSSEPLIELQGVLDNILAFWGLVDDSIDDECTRSLIKAGKRIERLDLFLRMKKCKDKINREARRLESRMPKTNLAYDKDALSELVRLSSEDALDYARMLNIVEGLVKAYENA